MVITLPKRDKTTEKIKKKGYRVVSIFSPVGFRKIASIGDVKEIVNMISDIKKVSIYK